MRLVNIILLWIMLLTTISCSQESTDFRACKRTNTEQAYSDFITKYPNTPEATKAKLLRSSLDSIEVIISTFLGNEKRNYYGDNAPSKLKIIWKFYLGEGLSPAYGKQKIWRGAGWTGQPLLVREKGELFIIQGAFDYHLRKIKAATGELIWEYKFDDILKGTGTIWVNHNADNINDRYVIIQGSRKGWDKNKDSLHCTSLRAVSYISGKELWRMNSKATDCYSRDVDGSPLVINDTAYLALENGIFTVFNPDYKFCTEYEKLIQPYRIQELVYYNQDDIKKHGDDLVSESSPTFFNNRIFTLSGTGRVHGYNIITKQDDWQFYLGSDLNGSAPLTSDNCLLIPVEQQYIKGLGGVMKINPAKPPDNCVEWYFPVDSLHWLHWDGGIIGSISINDRTKKTNQPFLAVFIDIAGYLYVIDYMSIEFDKAAIGPDGATKFPTPKLLWKEKLVGSIATPIIVGDKIVAPVDTGLYLYQFSFVNNNFQLKLLDMISGLSFDATPITYDSKIFIASLDGYLYCLGE